MNDPLKPSRWQTTILVALRFLIGWHLLYEGIIKLVHPEWSSLAFLSQSQWILSGFAEWVISSEGVRRLFEDFQAWASSLS